MKNSEKLQENLETVDQELSNDAIESISNSIKCLEKICGCGEIPGTDGVSAAQIESPGAENCSTGIWSV